MANWFADKLRTPGGAPAQPPPPPPQGGGHPGYAPNPSYVPGVWHGQQPQQQPQPQPGQYGAPGMPQQVAFQGRPQQFTSFTADGAMVQDDGHVAVLYDTGAFFGQQGGSEQYRTHVERCPGCGKNALATIDTDDRGNRLTRVSKVCMECNWPIQQSANILSGRSVKKKGRTKPARQVHEDHVVTVFDQGVRLDFAPQPQN
jgi:hypothetical protein